MNVLLISPKYVAPLTNPAPSSRGSSGEIFGKGGLGLHVGRLARLLSDHGCAVTVLTYSPSICGITDEGDIRVWRLSLSSADQSPEDLHNQHILREQFRSSVEKFILNKEHRPAVVHCHHHTGFPMAVEVRRLAGCPIVSTFHYLLADSAFINQESVSEATRTAERRVCSESDRLIAVSSWLANSITRSFNVSKDSIDIIHHGVELSTFESCAIVDQYRARLAPRGEKIFSFSGRLSSEKGLRPFLESARVVLQKCADVAYAVAGGKPDEVAAFRQEMQADPLFNGHVHFLGWIEGQDLAALRSVSYAVIVPSLYESFGYSAAEAMAASVPVIASTAGGLPEIVVDGVCGLLVNLETRGGQTVLNPTELAHSQIRMLTERGLRERLARGCHRRVNQHFSNEAMLRLTLNAYHRAIDARRI